MAHKGDSTIMAINSLSLAVLFFFSAVTVADALIAIDQSRARGWTESSLDHIASMSLDSELQGIKCRIHGYYDSQILTTATARDLCFIDVSNAALFETLTATNGHDEKPNVYYGTTRDASCALICRPYGSTYSYSSSATDLKSISLFATIAFGLVSTLAATSCF